MAPTIAEERGWRKGRIDDFMKELIELAGKIAEDAHAGVRRKYSLEPYINHPRRVADKLPERLKAAGLLHDVLEDNKEWDARRLRQVGIPVHVVDLVLFVTRGVDESYADFILRVRDCGRDAIAVKLADIEDNLSDLKPGSLRDKYELARIILNQPQD